MSVINGAIPVTGFIGPTDSNDTYAVTDAIFGIDGYRSVSAITARNSITLERRREGMLVYTQDDKNIWQLLSSPWTNTDSDWKLFISSAATASLSGNSGFLSLSGGTITGDTLVTQNFTAATYYSGSTSLQDILNMFSGGTGGSGFTGWTDSYGFNSIIAAGNNNFSFGDYALSIGSATTAYTQSSFVGGISSSAQGNFLVNSPSAITVFSAVTMTNNDPHNGQFAFILPSNRTLEWQNYLYNNSSVFTLYNNLGSYTGDYSVITEIYFLSGSTYIVASDLTDDTFTNVSANTMVDNYVIEERPTFSFGHNVQTMGGNSFAGGLNSIASGSSFSFGEGSIAGAIEAFSVSNSKLEVIFSACTFNNPQKWIQIPGNHIAEWNGYIFDELLSFVVSDGVNTSVINYTNVTTITFGAGQTRIKIPSITNFAYTSIRGEHYIDSSDTYILTRPAFALGYNVSATGPYSFATGIATVATGYGAHAEGSNTQATGFGAHAEGTDSQAFGTNSHAEGTQTHSTADGSHAEGRYSFATGIGSHAEGEQTHASGDYSHAEGVITTAGGNYSHSQGAITSASGDYSHAEGAGSISSGIHSHAEGNYTQSTGNTSHAEGINSVAGGRASHAQNFGTNAIGDNSHAEGAFSFANGDTSHSQGSGTTANGAFSHAGGFRSVANGVMSFVHGSGSTANGDSTIVLGNNITGNIGNAVYVPNLNINIIGSGSSINNLGIDANGFVVVGSAGGSSNFPILFTNPSSPAEGEAWIYSGNTGTILFSIRVGGLNKSVELN